MANPIRPKSRYHYLMVREDVAKRKGYIDGISKACIAIMDMAKKEFAAEQDSDAKYLRSLVGKVNASVPAYSSDLEYNHRHVDHALTVLNADDQVAEPLPDEDVI